MSRKRGFTAIGAIIAAWAGLIVLAGAPPALALHNAGLSCYACHTIEVDTGDTDSNTLAGSSFINKRVRTLPTMLARGFTPDGTSGRDFACTFCHSNASTNTVMKDMISDFSAQSHKHPVGADYTQVPWVDNNWEWLSNGANISSTGTLHCTGCHDPALLVYVDPGDGSYAYEHLATGWSKTVNPYALRDGNPATPQNGGNPATSVQEVNEFCASICHSPGNALGVTKLAHSASTAPNTVRGVLPGFTNCLSCHRAHYADQTDLIPASVGSPTQCRNCHKTPNYDGSAQNGTDGTTYYSGGHGKAQKLNLSGTLGGTIAYNCTQCHDSGIPHDFNTENRIPWNEATDQCGVCHDGTAHEHSPTGYTLLCNACHNAHGDGTGTNMWMIKTTIATPNSGNQPVVLTARTGMNSFDDGALNGENSVCSACHTATANNNNFSNGALHADGTNKEGQNCAASCHPHGNTPAFQQDCDNCHGYPPPPALGGRSEGAHPRHAAAPYGFSCAKCHSGYVHQDLVIDVHRVGETPPNQNPSWPSGSYTAVTNDTCDNTNCHNPYRLDGDAPTTNNPRWGDANGLGCSFCHTGKSSGAHEQHLSKGYACTTCHETWATTTAHVKGTLETTGLINFDNTLGIEATASFNETNTQCFNVYCHGDYGPGGLTGSPQWGVPGSGACGTCHLATPTSGAHTLHLSGAVGPRANCANCHGLNAETGTHATHVNGSLDMGAVGETLLNTAKCDLCHGDNAATHSERLLARFFWGQPAGSWRASNQTAGAITGNGDPTVAGGSNYCQWCHDATASVVNTPLGTGGAAMTAPDAKSSWAIDNGGHGRSGVNTATGNTMPGYECSVCHNVGTTGAHIDGTAGNVDRLLGALTRLTACADCHAPLQGAPGPVLGQDATVEASNHASSVLGHYVPNGAYNYACVVCHNPHGTSNIAMVNTAITDSMGAGETGVTLAAETGLDPNATLNNGVCDRCHNDGAQSHNLTTNPNNHNYGSPCLQCHDHTRSFEGSCSTCHGNNSNQTAWPEAPGNARNLYPTRAGRHPLHVLRLGERLGYGSTPANYTIPQQRQICEFCHNDSTGLAGSAGHFNYPYATGDEPADVGSFNQMWNPYAVDAAPVAGYGDATYSGNTFTGGTNCNAVDCHLEKNTPTGYEWYGSTGTGCALCHDDVTNVAVATGQTHLAHTNSVANGLGRSISCSSCHTSATAISWGSPGVQPSAGHINGTFLASGAVAFTYGGVFPTTPGSCAVNVCHNNGLNGTTVVGYTWGTTIDGTGSCTDCHNATTTLATNSHDEHLTTSTGQGAVCDNCHNLGSNPTHMNGSVTFTGLLSYTPASASSVQVSPSAVGGCGTNLCHNNGANGTPLISNYSWGTAQAGLNSCTECHDATTALATNSHDEHLRTTTGAGAACGNCHMSAQASTHADQAVTFAPILTYTPGSAAALIPNAAEVGGCGTNLCHNNGANGTPLVSNYSWGTAVGGLNSCGECHVATTALATNSHDEHLTTSTGAGAICDNCHTVATANAHTDGSVTFSAPTYTPASASSVQDSPAAVGGCGTNLCHNDGQNGTPLVSTYSWGTAVGGLNSCGECHVASSALGTLSHDEHLTTSTGAGAVCDNCHAVASAVTHGNGSVTFAAYGSNYPPPATVVAAGGGTVGGCGTNFCHNDGQVSTPLTSIYSWGTAVGGLNSCGECHFATSALATLSHDEHLTTSTGAGAVCDNCHAAASAGTHGNGSVTMAAIGTNYPAASTPVAAGGGAVGGCGTNLCHNNGQNAAPLIPAYSWGTAQGGLNSCGECHTATSALNTYSHDEHLGAAALFGITSISCDSCHAGASAATHGNGSVTLAAGGSNYPAGATPVATAGGTLGGCATNVCHTNGLGGAPRTSVYTWGTAITNCQECHGDTGATLATNAHPTHNTAAYGPFTACDDCHVAPTAAAHLNGTVTFRDGNPLSTTNRCSACHAGSTPTAVSEWTLGVGHWLGTTGGYCEHCHDGTPSVVNTQAGTGGVDITAWNAMGDGSTYGAAVRGHGKTSDSYRDADSVATNVAANRPCTACHGATTTHINGSNDTGYAGTRLLGTVNNVPTGGTVSGLCNSCHTGQGTSPSSSPVSSHGNQNPSYVAPVRDTANAADFTYRCEACHEPHGMTNGAGYVNIYMIRPTIGVGDSFTTLPGGSNTGTVTVRLQRITGTDSFDDTDDGSRLNNVCYACHVDSNRPDSASNLRTSGGDHTLNSGPLKSNERGKNCVNCHMHSLDNNFGGTADGFMPMECDSCHTYPSLATKPSTHRMTTPHDEHVGRPSDETAIGNKGYSCNTCHYLFDHNQSNFAIGMTWSNSTVFSSNINIRFDPNWNPGSPTYAGANASSQAAPGIDTHNGQCAGLYCHSPGGTGSNPSWTGTFAACTNCHADATNTMATQSHDEHLTTSTGAGAQCSDCHTAYDLASTGNHMNGSVTFLATLSYNGNTLDKIPTSGQGTCGTNTCHNDGQTGPPVNGYTWGSAQGGLNSCTECHNATSATLATLSHDEHLLTSTGAGAICDNCHASATVNTHANGSVTMASGGTNYPAASTLVAAGGGAVGGCGTNFCHQNGQTAAPLISTYSWGTAQDGLNSCTECHSATSALATLSHDEHLTTSTGAGAVCDNCHASATAATHGNGSVTTAAGGANYPAAATPVAAGGGTVGGCGTNFCHNNGANATPLVSTYSWGAAQGGLNSCGECHTATTALASNSHDEHLTTSTGGGAVCDNCHTAASANTHTDGSVSFLPALTYTPASATSVQNTPAAVGGCGTNLCHNNGQTAVPLISNYSWGTTQGGLNSCTECHSATTALATLSHDEHLLAATLFGINTIGCGSCHAAATLATHGDGTVTLAAGGSNYPAAATPVAASGGVLGGCATNACHTDGTGGAPRTSVYTWGTAITNCQECHGDSTGTVTSTSHPPHFNAVWGAALATCGTCHTAATATAHINGTANLLTAPGNTTPTTLAGTSVCNNCHGITTYDTETIKTNWPDAAPNTYAPGSGNPDVTCESCHGGGDMAAWQNANGTGSRAPSNAGSFTSTGHGLPTGSTYSPSGRAGAGADCIDCHNAATNHVSATGGDTDRLSTAGNALCSSCHDGGGSGAAVSQVSTHGNRSTTMGNPPASYTRQRAQFELDCVECHNVHGTTNIFMMNTASPNGPLSSSRWLNNSQTPTPTNIFNGTVNFQDNTVGASGTAGVGFANTAADASKICQTCHTTTGGTYQHNQATTGHATSVCTGCHFHDIDDNFASNSQDGFMPKGDCKDCHNGNTNYPLAPNVMTYWTGSNPSFQDGGHGDPQGVGKPTAPDCTDCHDVGDPPDTHLAGTSSVYNSIWANDSTRNTNTAHLKPEFFSRSAPPSLPVSAGAWSVQVTFDRYCAEKCHQDTTNWVNAVVRDMTHERDTTTSDGNHWSVQFGTHLTYVNGDTRAYPIDVDLNTAAAGGADYATCVSCHDPHGTGTVEPDEQDDLNHMLRDPWMSVPTLCNTCHN